MHALPDLENLETGSTYKHSSENKEILVKLISNFEKIKEIEEDNKKLQHILVESQKIVKQDYQLRIAKLVDLVKKQQNDYRELKASFSNNYNDFVKRYNTLLGHETDKNRKLIATLKNTIIANKKYEKENRDLKVLVEKTKLLLKKDFEKRLYAIGKAHRFEKINLKNTLKENEKGKISLEKDLELQKNRVTYLIEKHKETVKRLELIEKENALLKEDNKKFYAKNKYLNEKTIANDKELEKRFQFMKLKFEEKLRETAKEYLDKEIEYKVRIDSLNKDLARYIHEIKEIRSHYFDKENKLKEKIKEVFD